KAGFGHLTQLSGKSALPRQFPNGCEKGAISARAHPEASNERRPHPFQLIVYAGIDELGRNRFVRETHHGPRQSAETRLTQMVAAAQRGQTRSDHDRTLQELWDAWYETRSPSLSPNTVRGYERLWRRHVKDPLGHRRLAE